MKTKKHQPFNVTRLSIKQCLLLCCCLISFNAIADDEFNAFQKEMFDDFSDYKSKQDKEFTDFLKMHWVGMNALAGKPLYEKKKIIEPPKAPPVQKEKAPPAKEPVLVKIPPKDISPKKQIPKPKPIITPVKRDAINIEFYGNKLAFPYDRAMQKTMTGKVGKDSISDQWAVLAKSDYEPLMQQLAGDRKKLNLNDWAFVLMVHRVAQQLYPKRRNEQVMFNWFVLIKSGYKSRIAYQGSDIYLFFATKQKIYSAQSLNYKNTDYYALGFTGGKQPKLDKVFTYDGDYPNSNQQFDMQLRQAMVTGDNDIERKLEFEFLKKKYSLNTMSNVYMVEFMKTYPQVHWQTYFNSHPNTLPRQQLAEQLKPLVNGLSEQQAVNLLLRFVQTSLTYATDDKQFGYEKPLFPEETLFYPASDCEDRSFLFAWLVQELLGLDVVGLRYPGHMATAVRLNMNVSGDSVRYNGKAYMVADPTYINADVGMAMPKFKGDKVEFIGVSKI